MDRASHQAKHIRFATLAISMVAFLLSAEASAQCYDHGLLQLDTPTFTRMLDFRGRQTEQQLTLLESPLRRSESPVLAVGGQIRASAFGATTNREGKFSYLGRFPTDFDGNTAADTRILHANIAGAVHFTPWISGYFETLFSDVFSFADHKQGSFQVRQAYVVLGNFDVTPWYAYIGKKNTSFGDMSTLSPFTQSVVWHYFGGLSEGAGLGYAANGFEWNISALNGGRGIRVVDSKDKGDINNFAANYSYGRRSGDFEWRIGGGYLHGTIYNAGVAEHLDPNLFGPNNGAWDANFYARWKKIHVAGEYVTTLGPWPVVGEHVTAYRAEAAYDLTDRSWISASWSEGTQGPSGSQFEYNQQFVAGYGYRPSRNVLLTAEYVHSLGFAPLINIATVSDKSVRQHSVVFGMVLSI